MEGIEKNGTVTFEFDVRVRVASREKGELVDAIASSAKLVKVDAGHEADIIEDWIDITIDPSEKVNELPKLDIQTHSKLTKVDSERV